MIQERRKDVQESEPAYDPSQLGRIFRSVAVYPLTVDSVSRSSD